MAKTQEVEAKKRKKFEIKNGGSHQQMVHGKWLGKNFKAPLYQPFFGFLKPPVAQTL